MRVGPMYETGQNTRNNVIPDRPCERGDFSFRYFKPLVLKAGDAAVVPLKFGDRTPIDFPPLEKTGQYILTCVGFTVLTPSAFPDRVPVALRIEEIKEVSGPALVSVKQLIYDKTPIVIHHSRSISW